MLSSMDCPSGVLSILFSVDPQRSFCNKASKCLSAENSVDVRFAVIFEQNTFSMNSFAVGHRVGLGWK